MLLAKPQGDGLTYIGRVGTGFNDEQLRALRKDLEKTVVKEAPAEIELMERRDRSLAIWVRPKKIIEVFYQGVGGQGLLRQPAFKGFRPDKSLADLKTDAKTAKRTIARAESPVKKTGKAGARSKSTRSKSPAKSDDDASADAVASETSL